MVVVLPVPLTPTTRMTCGFSAGSIASGFATGSSTLSISAGDDLLRLADRDVGVEAAGAELFGDRRGGLEAEVGLEQEILEIVQGFGIDPPLGQDRGDPFRQRVGGARKPGLEPLQP